jgi:hypothetical protein
MDYDVAFVPNTDDDLHCLQSAYLMIIKFFDPDFKISWQQLDKATGFEKNKGTWSMAGLLWLKEKGFDVKHLTIFDYDKFATEGGDYLIEVYGEEVGDWSVKHSNLPLERQRAKRMKESGIVINKVPTRSDIKRYLDDGYLVKTLVNARKLNGKKGYFGHAVIIKGYDNKHFIIHDPGLPPLPNRKVKYEDFEAAWADPNDEAKELDAIKLN